MRALAIISVFYLIEQCAFGSDQLPVMLPSDLKRPCAIIDGVTLTDDYSTARVTLIDINGNKLIFSLGEPDKNGKHAHFRLQDNTWLVSEAGSAEERCVLNILKESLSRDFVPSIEHKTDDPSAKGYWTRHAVKHIIIGLEYRCSTKKEVPPGW